MILLGETDWLGEIGWFGLTGLAWRQRLGETESLSAISVVPQRL
jgi:hypothetical protein